MPARLPARNKIPTPQPTQPAATGPSSARRAPLRTLRYHSHVYRATPLLLWPGLLIMCMEHGVMRHVWWGVHTLVVAAVTDKTVAAIRCHRHSCRRRHRPAPRGWGRGDCRPLPPPTSHSWPPPPPITPPRPARISSVTTIINAPPCEGEHEAGTGRSRLCRPVATTRGRLGEQTMLGAVVVGDQVRPQKSGL